MATTDKNVNFNVTATLAGIESLVKLKDEVKSLGKEGALSSVEFEKFAGEITKLGEQSAALVKVQQLSNEVDELGAKQTSAAKSAADLTSQLKPLADRTEELRAKQAGLSDELARARIRTAEAALEIKQYKTSATDAAKGTEDYKQKVAELSVAQIAAKKAELDLREELRQTKVDAGAAAKAQKDYAESISFEVAESKRATTELQSRKAALSSAEAGLRELGVETSDLVAAQSKLAESNASLRASVDAVVSERQREIAADKAAADSKADLLARTRTLGKEFKSLLDERAANEKAAADAEKQAEKSRVDAKESTLSRVRSLGKEFKSITDQRVADEKAAADAVAAAEKAGADAANKARESTLDRARFIGKEFKSLLDQRVADEKAAAAKAAEIEKQRVADMAAAAEAEKRIAAEAKAAGDKIKDALGSVGVRSAADLRAEIERVRASLDHLKTTGTLSGAELATATKSAEARIRELERGIRAATGELTAMDRARGFFGSLAGQIAGATKIVDLAAIGIQKLASGFLDANVKAEKLSLGLNSIYKDAGLSSQQIDFLRDTASKAGVSVNALSESFVKFSTSNKSANVPLETSNQLFASVVNASARLGISSEKTALALDALSQMASKGVVNMEELRQQLGDSLPGALSLAAKGLNLTDQEMIKLVESGKLLYADFAPALTKSLKDLGEGSDTLSANFAKLTNALNLFFTSLGQSGVVDALKGALFGLGAAVGPVLIGINTLAETIFTTVRQIGAVVAAIVTRDFSLLGGEVERLSEESFNRQAKLIAGYREFIGVGDRAASTQTSLGTSANAAAGYTKALADAQQAAAAGAVAGTDSWNRLILRFEETKKSSEDVTLNLEKLEKATVIAGKSAVELAELSGNEAAKLDAASKAADDNAAASARTTLARESALIVLQKTRDALIEEAARLGDTSGARAKAIDDINKTIDARTAEISKSKEETAQLQVEAAQRQLAVSVTADNSAKLAQLTIDRNTAKASLDALLKLESMGLAQASQVSAARLNLAKSEAMVSDALRDTTEKLKANISLKQAEIDLTNAGLKVDLDRYKSLQLTAEAIGDENLATYAKIEQKKIEIKLIQAKTLAAKAEAEGAIAVAQATRAELAASGELTPVKQIELDTSILVAKAKLAEAGAVSENIKILQLEIDALNRNGGAKRGNASDSDKVRGSVDSEAGARYRNTDAIEAENAALAEQKRLKVDANGFSTDKNGNTIVAGGDLNSLTGIYNFLKSAGVNDDGVARGIASEFADSQGNITYMNNPGQLKYGGAGSTISSALLKAAEKYTFSGGGASSSGLTDTSKRSTSSGASTPVGTGDVAATDKARLAALQSQFATTSNTTRTVVLKIGDSTGTVNVTSDSDVKTLENMLRKLESSSARFA